MTKGVTRQNDPLGAYSERFPVLRDKEGRAAKAKKILAVLSDFSGRPLSDLRALDVGGSSGMMAEEFSRGFKEVVELDLDGAAVSAGREGCAGGNVEWICGDASMLPLPDKSFDCVICNHVYEHVDDQRGLASEIYRVLKEDGFCYWSAGSRFAPVEGHYKLPLLSWFPRPVSDLYMKLAGREGRYDVKLLSYRNLKKLLKNFVLNDYTVKILKDPGRFRADDLLEKHRIAFSAPSSAYTILYPYLPIWIWVLTKR
jgi:ubiquinone/menaquinone biosynthesis C-methylase UbiE